MDARTLDPALTRSASLAGTAVVPPPGHGGAAVPALIFLPVLGDAAARDALCAALDDAADASGTFRGFGDD